MADIPTPRPPEHWTPVRGRAGREDAVLETPTPRPLTAERQGKYAEAQRVYNDVKRPGRRVLTLPEIQRVIDAYKPALLATVEQLQAEVDRLTANLATTTSQRDAAELYLIAEHDALIAYLKATDDARSALERARSQAEARAAQPQEGTDGC